jgi:hypothetical protein
MAIEVASSLALGNQIMRHEGDDRLAWMANSVIEVGDNLFQLFVFLCDRERQRASESIQTSPETNDTIVACGILTATTVAVAELQALGSLVNRDPSVSSNGRPESSKANDGVGPHSTTYPNCHLAG